MSELADTKHFTVQEMLSSKRANELGIQNLPSLAVEKNLVVTMAGLERVRAMINRPVHILSGYRSEALNRAVGGSIVSQHMLGQAADFVSPEYGAPRAICLLLRPWVDILGIDQLICEGGWVHASFTLTPRGEALTYKDGIYHPGIV